MYILNGGNFMFNLENSELIKRIIDLRDKDKLIYPVCVKIDQFYWGIPELTKYEITGSSIKIVFGTSDNVFIKKKFPRNLLLLFDNVNMFGYFDEEKQVATDYFYFESDYVEAAGSDLINVAEEINGWCDILIPYVKDILEKNRREVIMRMMEENS
jgi:hypothetical protein